MAKKETKPKGRPRKTTTVAKPNKEMITNVEELAMSQELEEEEVESMPTTANTFDEEDEADTAIEEAVGETIEEVVEEPIKVVENVVEAIKEETKKVENKVSKGLGSMFGYVWNGQEMDY